MVSLILAIVSLVLFFFNYIIAALVALVALIVASRKLKKEKPKGYNIAGIIISSIVLVLSILLFAYGVITTAKITEKARQEVNEINEKYDDYDE